MLLVTVELGFEPMISKTMFISAAPYVFIGESIEPIVEFLLCSGVKAYARP